MRPGTMYALSLTLAVTVLTATARADEEPGGNSFGRWINLGRLWKRREQQVQFEPENTAVARTLRLRALEETAFRRRLAVCLKLYQIADETRDEALRLKAQQLDRLIWLQFCENTANVPAGPLSVGPNK